MVANPYSDTFEAHILFEFTFYVNKILRVKSYLFSCKNTHAVIENVNKFYSQTIIIIMLN